MIYITDSLIDELLSEDVRYGDLTTSILDIDHIPAHVKITSRQPCILSGISIVKRIMSKIGAINISALSEGDYVENAKIVLEADASAGMFHTIWKISVNILEYCTGIATRTNRLLTMARDVNELTVLAATRKTIPGTRDLSILATYAGGALPHRLGLSETVLIFKQHYMLCGGFKKILESASKLKSQCPEKKIIIEVDNLQSGLDALGAGFDGIQCDKMAPDDISSIVKKASLSSQPTIVIATGGINESNVKAYAKTGANVISTSSMYFGPPSDFGFEITKL
jgi:molybdenum transport protein